MQSGVCTKVLQHWISHVYDFVPRWKCAIHVTRNVNNENTAPTNQPTNKSAPAPASLITSQIVQFPGRSFDLKWKYISVSFLWSHICTFVPWVKTLLRLTFCYVLICTKTYCQFLLKLVQVSQVGQNKS